MAAEGAVGAVGASAEQQAWEDVYPPSFDSAMKGSESAPLSSQGAPTPLTAAALELALMAAAAACAREAWAPEMEDTLDALMRAREGHIYGTRSRHGAAFGFQEGAGSCSKVPTPTPQVASALGFTVGPSILDALGIKMGLEDDNEEVSSIVCGLG